MEWVIFDGIVYVQISTAAAHHDDAWYLIDRFSFFAPICFGKSFVFPLFLQQLLNVLEGLALCFGHTDQREYGVEQTECGKNEEAYVCAQVIVNRWICSAHYESN